MTRSRWPRAMGVRVCLANANPSVRRSAILMCGQVEICWRVMGAFGLTVVIPTTCCAAGIHQGFVGKECHSVFCAPLLE